MEGGGDPLQLGGQVEVGLHQSDGQGEEVGGLQSEAGHLQHGHGLVHRILASGV